MGGGPQQEREREDPSLTSWAAAERGIQCSSWNLGYFSVKQWFSTPGAIEMCRDNFNCHNWGWSEIGI